MSESFDKFSDPFAPPRTPCLVCCIHCGSTYDSWRIVWRDMLGEAIEGAWCCPIPGCDGIGFGFDIHPVDEQAAGSESGLDDDDEQEVDYFEELSSEEEEEDELPIDVFDDDAFWIDPMRIAPRLYGNTPQPPFNRAAHGFTSDPHFKDDDIPF